MYDKFALRLSINEHERYPQICVSARLGTSDRRNYRLLDGPIASQPAACAASVAMLICAATSSRTGQCDGRRDRAPAKRNACARPEKIEVSVDYAEVVSARWTADPEPPDGARRGGPKLSLDAVCPVRRGFSRDRVLAVCRERPCAVHADGQFGLVMGRRQSAVRDRP